jgi:hypothetical protein
MERTTNARDRTILRELAREIAEIGADPIQHERRRVCLAVNALKPIRPTVLCHPACAWDVLVPESALACAAPAARKLESALRARIYAGRHFDVDEPDDGAFGVPRVIRSAGWGVEPAYIRPDQARGSYAWDPPVITRRDLDRIRTPDPELDEEATRLNLEVHQELFGDLVPVRLEGGYNGGAGLIDEWAKLRGLNRIYLDMAEDPGMVHDGMRRLMEGRLAALESAEARGLLSPNHTRGSVGSGGGGPTDELPAPDFRGRVRLKDMWGFADSQTMAPVSPAMHEEFVLRYQAPLLERFGLTYYGCCEPLHEKAPLLKRRIPNLRKVSVSRWADRRAMARALGPDCVFECKTDPMTFASASYDEDAVRKDIRNTIELGKAHGCVMEFILDTADDIRGEPRRVIRWTQIAKEECLRAAG